MFEALIGLVGVVVGVIATGLKDWVAGQVNTRRKTRYLATRVVSLLDIFVNNCAMVVKDDGTYMGQPDQHGYYIPQTQTPKFEPLSLDVDWLSIDSELMHQVLYFPNDIYVANSKISAVKEYVADPPDYPEFFEERQYQYSVLALKAIKLVETLQKESGIESYTTKWDWFDADLFEMKIKNVEQRKIK
ncbi:hypothetical protein VCHA52P453_90145 [Vibrio chagasii]|nr:hypothetical protein VCHA39P226_110145 [Vibrio chagasii]CAH6956037.1 conserved hypothetical protein [Vibrio chagasii]CAH7435023.1 hypothetical protein VCHA52P453_90145 [Vibrio chagasii]